MNICVYGAASSLIENKYIESVEKLGREIGKRGHALVFGAGGSGLMGAAAKGVKETGGYITGVIPSFFIEESLEPIYDKCDEIIYTETMHERKQTMEDMADAFIVVPGGIGTYEEFFEILTLKQLGRHRKPIAFYNIGGYYDKLDSLIEFTINESFMRDTCRVLYKYFTDLDEMLQYIENDDMEGLTVHDLK